jgi:hypothetical protein
VQVIVCRPEGEYRMIVTTIDPVTGNKVTDLEHHPFLIEGAGAAEMKIYFESEDTKQAYLLSRDDITGWYGDESPPHHS